VDQQGAQITVAEALLSYLRAGRESPLILPAAAAQAGIVSSNVHLQMLA